jgi:hypothetical protein
MWQAALFAKPVPTRPVVLTEQQLRIVFSKISLPVQDLKYRVINAAVNTRTDPRNVFLNLETEYYEQQKNYRRYFAINCHWGAPDLAESRSCGVPSYIVELIGDGLVQKINVGAIDQAPIPVEEVIELAALFRSRPPYGEDATPLREPLVGLRATSNGYRASRGGGGCYGGVDVTRRRDGSLTLEKVYPLTCV